MSKVAVVDNRIPGVAWGLSPFDVVLRDDICQMMNEQMLNGRLGYAKLRVIDTLRSSRQRNWHGRKYHYIYFPDTEWLQENFPEGLEALSMDKFEFEDATNGRLELDRILDTLKPEDALLLRLKYVEGWTFRELSRYFDRGAQTLRKRCSVLMAKLRVKYGDRTEWRK